LEPTYEGLKLLLRALAEGPRVLFGAYL